MKILKFRDRGPFNALACEAKAHRHIRFVIGHRPTERVIARNEEKFLPNDCLSVASALLRLEPLTRFQVDSAWRDVGGIRGSREGKILAWVFGPFGSTGRDEPRTPGPRCRFDAGPRKGPVVSIPSSCDF